MSHLGTWVSALVDGQLSPAAAERALAHVAACPLCADEVAAARQARRALSVAGDVAPDPELTARLLALAATPGPATASPGRAPRRDHRQVVPLGESAYAVPARALSGDLGRRRPAGRVLTGALVGAGVVVAGLLVVGGSVPAVVPATHPAAALTALGRAPHEAPVHHGVAEGQLMATIASTSGRAADAAPPRSTETTVLEWMRSEGWTCPDALPAGYDVTAVRLSGHEPEVLEVDLAGPQGRVVLTEQHGRLDVASLGPVEERRIGARTLYVLSHHPWHVVWQSDDTVVSIVSEAPAEEATQLVQHFPATGYDDSIPARLTRGWDMVTGALADR